jgi:hypothetical protein
MQDAILGQLSAGNSPGDIVVNALNKAFPNAAFVSTVGFTDMREQCGMRATCNQLAKMLSIHYQQGNQQLARNAFGESERAILEEAIRQLALRLVTQVCGS